MHPLVDFLHKGVEMHAALLRNRGVFDEEVHHHRLATPHPAPQIKARRRRDRFGKQTGEQTDTAVGVGLQPVPQGVKCWQDRMLRGIWPQLSGGDTGVIDLGQGHRHRFDYPDHTPWERLSEG